MSRPEDREAHETFTDAVGELTRQFGADPDDNIAEAVGVAMAVLLQSAVDGTRDGLGRVVASTVARQVHAAVNEALELHTGERDAEYGRLHAQVWAEMADYVRMELTGVRPERWQAG